MQQEIKVSQLRVFRVPEVELLDFESAKIVPEWLDNPVPNIYRDSLIQKIIDLDADEERYITNRKNMYNSN